MLLSVQAQPFANHNGGGLAFDNDGRLYIALGDGGSGGDPLGNGQKLDTFLGKILRIDVDAATPYAVPADNPFRATPGAAPEIWAYGLRNPFRFSVDRPTGDLYIGDVGQSRIEEIDVGLASRRGGENYGWNVTEGSQCYSPSSGCNRTGLTPPVYEYTHAEGCSVTGGVVYRGCRMPDLAGTYFFGDYCTGLVRSFRLANGQATDVRDWTAGLPRRQLARVLRPRRRRRGLRRGLRRRGVPPRAGGLIAGSALSAIDKITAQTAPTTFANTIAAMERSDRVLKRAR